MFSSEFQQIIEYRRTNRKFDVATEVSDEIIQKSLERAILSPNSSNMQLWEFHWIRSKNELEKFATLCFNQNAARTAKHLVVFVTRRDKWKQRAKWNLNQILKSVKNKPDRIQQKGIIYYSKAMPLLYMNDFLGVMSLLRRLISFAIGLFRPFYRSGGTAGQRIVVHKSCALAAQTFMLSVAAEGFHTCPMEGFDEIRVKKLLRLPRRAEINMIVAVGKGTPEGVWGPRLRVPDEEVIFVH
jgi:nitroreductase